MDDPTREQLRRAYDHIKGGRRISAVQILRPLLAADPSDADAWWLMANAVDDPAEQQGALEKVVALRPDHPQARERLAALTAEQQFRFDEAAGETSFADLLGEAKPKRVPIEQAFSVVPPKQRTNPIIIILAIIGALSLAVCVGCFILSAQVTTIMTEAVSTIMESVTVSPVVIAGSGDSLPDDTINKGSIRAGDSRRDTVRLGESHAYTFIGDSGQDVTIEVAGENGDLAPGVALYNPSDIQIVQSGFLPAFQANNTELNIDLVSTGTYTIVVTNVRGSGDYTLTLS